MEKTVIDACIKRGQELPERMANAPQLFAGLEFYYNAFSDLSSCRINGMGIGVIPWTAINEWAKRYEVTGESFEELVLCVRSMDDVYIEFYQEKSKKDNPQ